MERVILSLAAATIVFVVYFPSRDAAFVYDDHESVANNPLLANASKYQWIWGDAGNHTLSNRPATTWTFGLNAMIGGHSAVSYRLGNIFIHALNVFLASSLILLSWRNLRSWVGTGLALIWGVHPLNTQAVTYIVQRAESQAACFILIALLSHIVSLSARRRTILYACRVLFVTACWLAVLSKETGAVAPFIPLLWSWVIRGDSPVKLLRTYPVSLLGGLTSVLMLLWMTWQSPRMTHLGSEPGLSPFSYLWTQSEVLFHYLRLVFWPVGLSVSYDWPLRELVQVWPAVLFWACVLGYSLWGVFFRKRWALLATSGFFFLAVSSSVIPLPDYVFEHRMYLATLCVILLSALLVSKVVFHQPWLGPMLIFPGVVILVALSVATIARNDFYRDELLLWNQALEVDSENRLALMNRGAIKLMRGNIDEALNDLTFCETLGIPPRYEGRFRITLGSAKLGKRDFEGAVNDFSKAITAGTNLHDVHVRIGLAYMYLNRFQEAANHYATAITLMPDAHYLWFDLASALTQLGEWEKAAQALQRGMSLGAKPPDGLSEFIARGYRKNGGHN